MSNALLEMTPEERNDSNTKLNMKKLIRQINERKNAIAKERDKLRGLIDEWGMLADNCDNAIDHLERAADELSQLV